MNNSSKRNKTLKIVSILSILILSALLIAGCGKEKQESQSSDAKKTKITFVLDWTPNTNHTGLFVAKEMGYFEKAGLDVEIVQPPEDGAEALVASGKAQFGVSFQDSMAPALVGDSKLPITAVAAVLQHNTSGIISLKGKGMDRPKGMEGKTYATWDLPVEKAMVKEVVEKDGGDFSKVKLVPSTITDEVSALKSNSVDAIWIFYGWAGIKTEVENLPCDYFAFKDINPEFDYYTPVIIGNNDFLKNKSDVAKKFIKALSEGYEYAAKNPEKSADILIKSAPELDKKLVLASQKYISKEYISDAKQWGYFDKARWSSFYGWLNKNKLISPAIDENAGFTNDFLPEK